MRGLLTLSLLLSIVLPCGPGCAPSRSDDGDFDAQLAFDPSPPAVGEVAVQLTLTDAAGAALEKAVVKIEGNMNHAGMKPSFADLTEIKPGRYSGALNFTMGGDWFVLVTATLPDGRRLERKIDVEGVRGR